MRNGRAWATGAVVGVLVLLGLPASGSMPGDREVSVTGVLLVVADAPGSASAFALALDDGSLVPVAGKPRVGRTLTVRPGTWPAGVALTYRWLADGKALRGADRKRLVLFGALEDARLSVRVTARKRGHHAVSVRSARTAKVSG